jgi:hypothetical protein
MIKRKLSLRLLVAGMILGATLFLSSGAHVRAAWVGNEGEEWLSWDNNRRETYVRGFVEGIGQGFSRACGATSNTDRSPNYAEREKISHECWKAYPLSKNDQALYVDSITKYYADYPKQRPLYIATVLLEVNAGHTFEQINANFPVGEGKISK